MESGPTPDPMLPHIEEALRTLGAAAQSGEVSPEVNAPASMRDRRPDWLVHAINTEFDSLPNLSKGYSFHGLESDYKFGKVTATEIIRQFREKARSGGPVRVLDIGTGAGCFITGNTWNDDDVAHGVTGQDYRTIEVLAPYAPEPDDPRYIVGNAEYLDDLPGLLPKYDVVVSKMTYLHFVDEIGTLEQIANRVVRGGLLCLDLGIGNRRLPVSLLQQHGFEFVPTPVVNDIDRWSCTDIVMQRTGDPGPIKFNVEYRQASAEDVSSYEMALNRQITSFEMNRVVWGYETDDT
jgi:hypothetical protein